MSEVDRVLRYVAGTATLGQTYCTYGLPSELYVTVGVSYNCHADSKSHTGVSLHYGRFSTPFISMSKKQSIIIADSSTAAEFIGAHTGAQAIMWARNFLEELGFLPLDQLNDLHSFIYLKFSFHFAPLNCCVVELVGLSSSHHY